MNYGPKLLVQKAPPPLYCQLADTAEIRFARELTEMQSEVAARRLLRLPREQVGDERPSRCGFCAPEQVPRGRPPAPGPELLLSAPPDGREPLR